MQTEELVINEDINEEDTDKVSSSDDIEQSVIEESEETAVEESADIQESAETEESIEDTEESEEEKTSVDESGELLESEITASEESTTIVDQSSEEETETESETVTENIVFYSSDISSMDYTELYQEMVAEQRTTNELLYRINEQNDFIIGVGVTLIICCVSYAILEKFCRF